MKDKLEALLKEGLGALAQASTEEGLQELRVKYLGKKGELTSVMKGLGSLSPEERPVVGQVVNTVKGELEEAFDARAVEIREAVKAQRLAAERLDVTLPGRRRPAGSKHPITLVTEEICSIFGALGFAVAEGPEVELDFYNFEALNLPKDHPARDMQDTFYFGESVLLRTHSTSASRSF